MDNITPPRTLMIAGNYYIDDSCNVDNILFWSYKHNVIYVSPAELHNLPQADVDIIYYYHVSDYEDKLFIENVERLYKGKPKLFLSYFVTIKYDNINYEYFNIPMNKHLINEY